MSANTGRAPSALTALPGGNKRKRRNDYFISSLNSAGVQSKLQSLRAGSKSHGVTRATGLGDFRFECFALRAEHKLLRRQHVLDGRAHFRRNRFELRAQVKHRNRVRKELRGSAHRGFV